MPTSTLTAPPHVERPRSRRSVARGGSSASALALARYTTPAGQLREVVTRPVPRGALVIDRDAMTLSDARLVALLEPGEPASNAELVCRLYIEDGCPRCRAVTAEDGLPSDAEEPTADWRNAELVDAGGRRYRLATVPSQDREDGELRWTRKAGPTGALDRQIEVVTLRDVVAALEDYSPARELTGAAIADRTTCSTAALACDLRRLDASPIVLNRGLREAVVQALAAQSVTLSTIAIRCGRTKRDSSGRVSGETSWLARRIGLLAPGGETAPTPWVSSNVLALIARRGLGIAPVEVEL